MNNIKYVIFDTSEIFKLNFNDIKETSIDSLRKSIDGTKTFVKFSDEIPQSIMNLNTKSEVFTHNEIINILSTEEWTKPIEEYNAIKH